ncbi:hypothetical protein Gotri_020688, partial [Gossypium trilobum]|nr:hypothetical protein [Gossypium trilobum]
MRLVELDTLRNAIVGLPGSSGLSTEQRKRLTIAVELVANPSIIFMDEPTSGLDARAAAIVMRTVRNTVDTGRTVVCTIHQPSIDIFEAFDELLLLKRGGRVIYGGKLGVRSQILIDYFQSIDGIPSIPDGYNPATWMLEVTNPAVEQRTDRDFADIYQNSEQHREVEGSITRLSVPPPDSQPLKFSSIYSQDQLSQFLICLKKQTLVYWRSPRYNLVRLVFTMVCALIYGSVFWDVGNQRQPIVSIERTVFYRERAAGFYAPISYAAAQHTASVLSSAFYSLWNLHSGFLVPKPRIPGWWIWFYYICPVAWSLKGIISSQLGDVETMIVEPTFKGTVKEYVSTSFGIDVGMMGPTVA